jgi:hypothetical protein
MVSYIVYTNTRSRDICDVYYNSSFALALRRSRVIGDYGGYRRLIAYLAVFGREGDVRQQCVGKGGCIGLERVVDIGRSRRFDMNRDIMLRDVSMYGPHSVQKCVFSKCVAGI